MLDTPTANSAGPPAPALTELAPLEAAVTETPAPPEPSPASGEPPPRSRLRRWPLRVLRASLVLLLIPVTVLAGAEVLTPSVSGAPALVAAVDRDHRTQPIPADPTWRISVAIVAAEDGSFYTNQGVDLPGLARALWGRITGVDEGGSTITEQLAKVIYTGGRTGVSDRVAQVALALKLDGHYSKTAVLSMYLSAIYFGNGYYGVLAASQGYFGLSPDRLSWGQATLLAGLPQAPSLLDPFHNLAGARGRQAYVLDRLVATGLLTLAQAQVAAAAPLGLR